MIPKPTRQVAIVLTIAITSPISAETAKKLAHHKKIAPPEKASVHSGWLAYVISQLCWAINWITNRLRSTGLIATEIWFGWPKWEVNPPMFLRMEFFYREMRRRSGVLMERAKPEGGQWNYDAENRKSFGKSGPGLLLATPRKFEPDSITRDVLSLVARTFPDNPGSLEHFDFPVTATEAQLALDDFVEHRLPKYLGENALDAHEDLPDLYWTTLYWDLLIKHQARLEGNQQMMLQVRNVARTDTKRREQIQAQAKAFRDSLSKGHY